MNKKLFAIALAVMLLIGCIAVSAAAAGTVDTIDELQAAVNAYTDTTTVIQLSGNIDGDKELTVTKDVYLDLNGYNITCPVSITGGTLYCMDTKTDDYNIDDGEGYGVLTNVSGNVDGVPAEAECVKKGYQYLKVAEGTSLSFHRVDLQIHSMVLRASEVGLYYKCRFGGDRLVKENVKQFGVALSVKGIPNKDNLESDCKYSRFTEFSVGNQNEDKTSTLLKGVMKTTNANMINRRNAKMSVYGRAYILTDSGYVFGKFVERSLIDQVEDIASDTYWPTYDVTKKAAVISMYRKYVNLMRNWKVSNIESALCLDKTDPLIKLEDGADIKVLALTSSFGLNTTQMLYDVIMAEAKAQGITLGEVTIARLYASGCTLEKHITNAPNGKIYEYYKVTNDPNDPLCTTPGKMMHLYGLTHANGAASMSYGFADEEWDIIFTQQGAAQAPQLDSYLDKNGQNRIDQWKAILDQYKPSSNTRFVWNMLWGYQSDCTIDPFPRLFNSDQMYMYQCNIDAVMKYVVPRTDFDRIIPTGTVIQNARTSEFGDHLCRDTYHLNNYGGIMAAYGLYAVITGQELTEINIDPVYTTVTMNNGIGGADKIEIPLTETQKAIMIESVNNALKNPFALTESQYPEREISYTSNLQFIGDTKIAVCPACHTEVTWTEIETDSNGAPTNTSYFGTPLTGGTYHFYLSSDVTYTGSANPFIYINASSAATGGQRKVCLHLNSHNLTATKNTVATIGANGILNVMGQGTVSGGSTLTNRGSTIVINSGASNTSGFGAVRLYSGTYEQATGNTVTAPVSTGPQGGLLEIYEDVVIKGNTNSLWLNTSNNNGNAANNYLETVNIYGGTFTKPVVGSPSAVVTTSTTLNISGGTFNGGITPDTNTVVTLSGAPVISGAGLKVPEGTTVTLDNLTAGASIAVDANGAFTVANSLAADYLKYFSAVQQGCSITAQDNILYCN